MTVEPGDAAADAPVAEMPDCGHLDQDPEALEDPVHRGDAQHQHELHEHDSHEDPADRAG